MQAFPLERVEGFHHGQAAPGRWRLARRHRRAVPLALARGFGLLGAGCQGPSAFALPEHLQIAIAYGAGSPTRWPEPAWSAWPGRWPRSSCRTIPAPTSTLTSEPTPIPLSTSDREKVLTWLDWL